MKISKLAWGSLALIAGLGLAACGGGGGSSTASTPTNNTSVGVITGFGSVYVNGCEYETDSASITVEGQSGSEDDLSVGDVVEVSGPANCTRASASSIKYADELEGVVDSNAVSGGIGTMIVMGQNITVNDMTIFEDDTASIASVDDIATGHVVEISGFGIGSGDIVATRIEVKATSLASYTDEIELKGVITAHDDINQTFMIGNLTIDYGSQPAILDDLVAIDNDLYVEVKASVYTPGSLTLVATKVEREDDGEIGHQGDDDEEYEIKGMLTAAYDADSRAFGINDQMVLIDDNTELEDISLADLNAGNLGSLYMEVEGNFNADGMLVAEEVGLEDDDVNDSNEVSGYVSNLVTTDNNNGTLTVAGVNLTVTNDSIMQDSEGATPETKFNLSFLRDGDFVEVHYDAASGLVSKLERDDTI
ncbi:MAG: DUF5666 domain-containing protein [Thioalkalispiraceae bacterium]|jgi:hypothetical protein